METRLEILRQSHERLLDQIVVYEMTSQLLEEAIRLLSPYDEREEILDEEE